MLQKIKNTHFFKFLKNIKFLLTHDLYKDISAIQKDFRNLQNEIHELKIKSITSKILNYYGIHQELSLHYKMELSYISENELDIVFPYKRLKELKNIQSGYDNIIKLPFVMHHNKKLFFPSTWSVQHAENTYRNFIESENILGGNFREKSPHQYQTDTFYIHEGDTLLDIGAAEALLALDAIEKIKKLYLVESDPLWLDALNATFDPYKEKVAIVNKLISDVDSDKTITLSSLLKNEELSSLFIKMDIEGYETKVIAASKDILLHAKDIRIACCIYHKHDDANILADTFTALNYKIEFSDGYMLFTLDELKPPYFRKGIIRAEKTNMIYSQRKEIV
jgi:hypothetical protein